MTNIRSLNRLQKISLSLMAAMVLLTFMVANLHTILWQSSEWLVSTVLPAVVVDLTNDERVENNASPLTRNETLDAAAKMKARHMAQHEYFAHYSPEGVSPWHWFDEAGYTYAHAGENLAIHFTDSSDVIEAWMDSPTHRKNIVDPKYTEIGVGTAKGEFEGYDTVYVVQLFGAPAYVAPEPAPVAADPLTTPVAVVADEIQITPAEAVVTEESISAPVLVAKTNSDITKDQTVSDPIVLETVSYQAEELAVDSAPEPTTTNIETETETETETTPVTITMQDDTVIIESSMIATSSGLAIAQVTTPTEFESSARVFSFATQPNQLLQMVYMILSMLVAVLLVVSIVLEARKLHYQQVTYSIALLFVMVSLGFIHSLLTGGAVIL